MRFIAIIKACLSNDWFRRSALAALVIYSVVGGIRSQTGAVPFTLNIASMALCAVAAEMAWLDWRAEKNHRHTVANLIYKMSGGMVLASASLQAVNESLGTWYLPWIVSAAILMCGILLFFLILWLVLLTTIPEDDAVHETPVAR